MSISDNSHDGYDGKDNLIISESNEWYKLIKLISCNNFCVKKK